MVKTRWRPEVVISLFFGAALLYFIWLIWNKLTEVIGDSNLALVVIGAIVFIGYFFNYLSIDKILRGFGR